MIKPEHSARILLRGDEYYNPRFTHPPEVRSADGTTRITGIMKPDSPDGVKVWPPLPEIPFRYIVPADAEQTDYQRINVETWRRLRSGETLWDLDFAPPSPQPPKTQLSAGVVVLTGLVFGTWFAAFGSQN